MKKAFFPLFIAFLTVFAMIDNKTIAQEKTLRLHYQRADNNYQGWGLWLWGDVEKPSQNWPKGATLFQGIDDFGAFLDIKVKEEGNLNFLVLHKETEEKDGGDRTIYIKKGAKDAYFKENDSGVYLDREMKGKSLFRQAYISDLTKITLIFNDNQNLDPDFFQNIHIKDKDGKDIQLLNWRLKGQQKAIISGHFSLNQAPLEIKTKEKTVIAQLHWTLIDRLYACYDAQLGCDYADGKANFRLWAPLAEWVDILVFDKDDQRVEIGRKSMKRGPRGLWEISLDHSIFNRNLEDHYYQYQVKNPGLAPKTVLDPYAKSMAPVTISPCGQKAGSSGDLIGKGAIINPDKYGKVLPFSGINNYKGREDAIIWEIHIRDFTSDPAISDQLKAPFGTFAAFSEKLDYIKDLGVTHIQFLPVTAWYYGDETKMRDRELHYSTTNNQYNWGYDPQNYFSLDGAYTTKPEKPGQRIEEFKNLINQIHKAGMGIILDVVYTHMANASFLNDIVPNYYFFMNPDGNFLGDFGNNLATNRIMAEKLMVDSVKYLFSQYGIDGMRWDMMGDATSDSVQNAFDTAKKINEKTIFIGEGWRTFKGHMEDQALAGMGADQDWMAKTDSVGVFSDEFRNELKSGFGCEGMPAFLTGGKKKIESIFANIKAQPKNTPATAPGDMVQYIEAHDNLPLYDVIAQSIKKDPQKLENDWEIHRRIRLGNALLLLSQGTAFLHAGQEYGRTKQWLATNKPEHKFHILTDENDRPFANPYFIHDSYDSSDAINRFDWKKATDSKEYPENAKTREFTRNLIALRRYSDAFRLKSQALVNENLALVNCPEIMVQDLAIAWTCIGQDGKKFLIIVNADDKERQLTLPFKLDNPQIVCDGEKVDLKGIKRPQSLRINGEKVRLSGLSVGVIRLR